MCDTEEARGKEKNSIQAGEGFKSKAGKYKALDDGFDDGECCSHVPQIRSSSPVLAAPLTSEPANLLINIWFQAPDDS